MVKVTLKDGSVREYEDNVTLLEVAKSLSQKLGKQALLAVVDGQNKDLSDKLTHDASVEFVVPESEEGLHAIRHTAAHVMAQAIQHLFPDVKFAIGPAIANGFYYDLDSEHVFTPEDLAAIEKEMAKIIKANIPLVRAEIPRAEALKMFEEKNEKYKVELINDLPEDAIISTYTQGDFTDLCAGPHCPSTGRVKAFKLQSIAGAYWRGDEHNKMLQRIYGTAFPSKEELDAYLHMLEEAAKRDHRKLGKEMELFTFSSRVGLGLPLWLPRGSVMRFELEKFLRKKQNEYGYLPVVTPHIGSKDLYVTSGHYAKYGKDSFQPIHTPQEGEEYMLKPMNCPHHCEIFRSSPRSYKDLPLRLAEFGTVYRYEQSGELHGLTRVRSFTQDDAHMFVTPDQLKGEFEKVIDLILYVFRIFKFDKYTAQVSLRDPNNKAKYIGSDENWEKAENAIIEAAKEKGLKTVVEYGEAAFYGPKLDFMVKDAIGRKWQLGTIQVDYNLPERFQLEYTDADGSKKRPIMIHRAPFGSIERFTAVLLEHTGGHLPLWLSPDQIKVLPVSEKYADYAKKVCNLLNNSDIRTSLDDRNETLGKRIREISQLRVPVLVIVGEKEVADGTVSVRREGADAGTMKVDDFVAWFKAEMAKELV